MMYSCNVLIQHLLKCKRKDQLPDIVREKSFVTMEDLYDYIQEELAVFFRWNNRYNSIVITYEHDEMIGELRLFKK